ncbi:MAG TPA: nucleotide sugar dehydrogenase [Gammaproteobacteria bacterium]|nr:nucleotide sugar dehydrogenase [Gammaproteobacteria bacterium]
MHKSRQLAVIGLGYVGLPVAVAFAAKRQVIAFDIKLQRILELKNGIDKTGEVSTENLQQTHLKFTADPEDLHQADTFIVAVPTPINRAKQPDFTPLIEASKLIGRYLKPGAIVIYESTVYPGATEEVCAPILEQASQLQSGVDFFLGYSPERINPGDREHSFTKICKVVSGQTEEVLEIIANLYAEVVEAGVYSAPSIQVAEAAKVIENTQRDLNIALVNELAMIFNTLNIDTAEVLKAAATKWNFLPFKPGLVGGHCIGVDPYYLTHKALMSGLHPEVILAGRRINDDMGKYIAAQTVKQLIHGGVAIKQSRVAVCGLTFKENCADMRNSKVVDVVRELQDYGIEVTVHDPVAEEADIHQEYGLQTVDFANLARMDALILAVPHQFYLDKTLTQLTQCLSNPFKLVVDVKSVLDRNALHTLGVQLWRL